MHKGYLCIVLHAHLPYMRHPEHDYFLEENWLYEAMTETYIPLLDVFERLINDDIDFKITLSLSPPLVEMFNDGLLRARYKRYLGQLIHLTEQEVHRTKGDIHFGPIARMYRERFRRIRYLFENIYRNDLVGAFRALQDTHKIEIIPSTATHAFLPNLSIQPRAVKAQIELGYQEHCRNFAKKPHGMWLPECGFAPGFDHYLSTCGIKFFFLDTHGIVYGKPVPQFSVYTPVACPAGVAAFGRDVDSSKQVWSSLEGYPGDAAYRDFYRDIGFDLDLEYLKSHLHPDMVKTFTGLKYYRVTGKTDKKEPYVVLAAQKIVEDHAHDFVIKKDIQIQFLSEIFKSGKASLPPVVTATYDAELFGHWWFEGLDWLESALRKIGSNAKSYTTITPSEYLNLRGCSIARLPACEPSLSSWGNKGYNEVWLNSSNDHVYRHLLKTTERMIELADAFSDAKGTLKRALNQATREVLLSQQSDWAFIMKSGTATQFAKKSFQEHVSIFNRLYQAIIHRRIPEKWLRELELRDNIFHDVDYRIFRSRT
jgi:1,4-alpha-glucan branching enzyme